MADTTASRGVHMNQTDVSPADADAPTMGGAPKAFAASSPTWRAGLLASVALHGAAIAPMILVFSWSSPADKAAEAAMTVEIAPAVSAPPAPPHEAAPGERQLQAIARPTPVEKLKIPPPPSVKLTAPAEVAVAQRRDPQPDDTVSNKTMDQTTAPQPLPAPPDAVQAAPVAGASSSASSAPQTWENQLLAKLQQNKRYPGAAQARHLEDVVYVRLVIDLAGRLADARIVRSRGFALLDQEVVSLAHRASPFPAPPAAEGRSVEVVVPVEFFISQNHAQ